MKNDNWKERLDCWGKPMYKHKDLNVWIISNNIEHTEFKLDIGKDLKDKIKQSIFKDVDSAKNYVEEMIK